MYRLNICGAKIFTLLQFRTEQLNLENNTVASLKRFSPKQCVKYQLYTCCYGAKEVVSMNITDITKRKEIESAIRKQNIQLKKIAWLQSHQIRKPVANILGLIPLFDNGQLNEEQKELLHHLNISAEELDSYIKEIVIETKPFDADN